MILSIIAITVVMVWVVTFIAREKWIWKERDLLVRLSPVPQPNFGKDKIADVLQHKVIQLVWLICLPFYLCTTAILILSRRQNDRY